MPGPPRATPPGVDPPPGERAKVVQHLPPAVLLGRRAEVVRRQVPVIPVLVLVPDARSYVAALSRWTVRGRFPVLIDDGSWQAQQDIARFARAFAPASVVRWRAPEDDPAARWPAEAAGRQLCLQRAVAVSWTSEGPVEPDAILAMWKGQNLTPPGVVVTCMEDPAWTAALALAIGRGQPIVWAGAGTVPLAQVDGSMTMGEADALSRKIEEACRASGLSWEGLGDDLDAITLCLSCPVKVRVNPDDHATVIATTDLIGRHLDAPVTLGAAPAAGVHVTHGRERRWAWCGQVFGDEARAAWRAMCALYLVPQRAWLVDGYGQEAPFDLWDMTKAAKLLDSLGVRPLVSDVGGGGGPATAREWRRRAGLAGPAAERGGGPLGAGLILVNASGNPEFFDLREGRGLSGDVPVLSRPALVHFVHSWSAHAPGSRWTIGGRMLDNGAFAYIGSVHEPFLQAFVQTPAFVQRLGALGPWGVAGRQDGGAPWKVAVVGDPLWCLGPAAPRASGTAVPLAGARALAEDRGAALRGERFEEAARLLALEGRDGDVVRLYRAVSGEKQDRATPGLAAACLASLFFEGEVELVVRAARSVLAEPALAPVHPRARDILWHAVWPAAPALREEELEALKLAVRDEHPTQAGRDAAEIGRLLGDRHGPAAMEKWLGEARARFNADQRRALEQALAGR